MARNGHIEAMADCEGGVKIGILLLPPLKRAKGLGILAELDAKDLQHQGHKRGQDPAAKAEETGLKIRV
jgi:hypothetical protein